MGPWDHKGPGDHNGTGHHNRAQLRNTRGLGTTRGAMDHKGVWGHIGAQRLSWGLGIRGERGTLDLWVRWTALNIFAMP